MHTPPERKNSSYQLDGDDGEQSFGKMPKADEMPEEAENDGDEVGTLELHVIEAELTRDTDTFGKMDPWI